MEESRAETKSKVGEKGRVEKVLPKNFSSWFKLPKLPRNSSPEVAKAAYKQWLESCRNIIQTRLNLPKQENSIVEVRNPSVSVLQPQVFATPVNDEHQEVEQQEMQLQPASQSVSAVATQPFKSSQPLILQLSFSYFISTKARVTEYEVSLPVSITPYSGNVSLATEKQGAWKCEVVTDVSNHNATTNDEEQIDKNAARAIVYTGAEISPLHKKAREVLSAVETTSKAVLVTESFINKFANLDMYLTQPEYEWLIDNFVGFNYFEKQIRCLHEHLEMHLEVDGEFNNFYALFIISTFLEQLSYHINSAVYNKDKFQQDTVMKILAVFLVPSSKTVMKEIRDREKLKADPRKNLHKFTSAASKMASIASILSLAAYSLSLSKQTEADKQFFESLGNIGDPIFEEYTVYKPTLWIKNTYSHLCEMPNYEIMKRIMDNSIQRFKNYSSYDVFFAILEGIESIIRIDFPEIPQLPKTSEVQLVEKEDILTRTLNIFTNCPAKVKLAKECESNSSLMILRTPSAQRNLETFRDILNEEGLNIGAMILNKKNTPGFNLERYKNLALQTFRLSGYNRGSFVKVNNCIEILQVVGHPTRSTKNRADKIGE